jgi:hypothetical protein
VNIYTSKETCQHCGRGIKTVCVLYDSIENKKIHVGSKCVENIMNLNETFAKAVVKEIDKYSKLLKQVNEFNPEKQFQEFKTELEKFNNGIITKDNKYFDGMVWDEEKHCHRAYTMEEWENKHDEMIKHYIYCHENYNIRDLKEQREKLNKLSKKGLINMES